MHNTLLRMKRSWKSLLLTLLQELAIIYPWMTILRPCLRIMMRSFFDFVASGTYSQVSPVQGEQWTLSSRTKTAPLLTKHFPQVSRIYTFFKHFNTMRLPDLHAVRAFRSLRDKDSETSKSRARSLIQLAYGPALGSQQLHILRNMAVRLNAWFNL